jgi:hypothetical protein
MGEWESLDEMRCLWAEESDETLFEALTIGRDRYMESALGSLLRRRLAEA